MTSISSFESFQNWQVKLNNSENGSYNESRQSIKKFNQINYD